MTDASIIDAHHHFWDPADDEYPWMSGRAAALKRVFAPADLAPELAAAGVTSTVLVQTRSSLEETVAFLEMAAATDFVAGVVGWVDLAAPDVSMVLASLKAHADGRYLVGIRHQVHDEADPDWLLRDDVRRGLAAVEAHDLVYDLLVRPRELPAAIRTIGDFPGLRFAIDHIAKPDIANGAFEPWASLMREVKPHRGHVWCKLSGMVTEADWTGWTPADLAPFVREALAVFGASRCLFGSDWPVSTLAGTYGAVLDALKENIAHLSPADRAHVLSGSARELYRLQ